MLTLKDPFNHLFQHFSKLHPVDQVDQLVVDLEHAGAQGQPHEAAHVGEEAVKVVDDVLFLLDVGPLVDGQDEEHVRVNALLQGCQMAKLYPFLFLLCARAEGVGAQRGSNFAA